MFDLRMLVVLFLKVHKTLAMLLVGFQSFSKVLCVIQPRQQLVSCLRRSQQLRLRVPSLAFAAAKLRQAQPSCQWLRYRRPTKMAATAPMDSSNQRKASTPITPREGSARPRN